MSNPATNQQGESLVQRYWRGEVTLGKSYWLGYVLLSFVVLLASGGISAFIQGFLGLKNGNPLLAWGFFGPGLAYMTFAIISTWRSSKNAKSQSWGLVTRFFLVLGGLNVAFYAFVLVAGSLGLFDSADSLPT